MSLSTTLAGLSIAVVATAVQVDGVTAAYEFMVNALDDIRGSETVRQQDIQNTVCEMQGTAPQDCPRITIARTVIQ